MSKVIFNLTQHQPTKEQIEVGVTDRNDEIAALLNFTTIPTDDEVVERASKIVYKVVKLCASKDFDVVLLGDTPFLMGHLEEMFANNNIKTVYAFYERVSVETVTTDENEVVNKTNQSKHVGFVKSRATMIHWFNWKP